MVGTSLLEALVRTIFSIPREEWSASDLEVVKKYLEEAIQLKGLSKVTEVAVSELIETLEVLKRWDGPEPRECMEIINQVFHRAQEAQSTVQITVPKPTVSSCKCHERQYFDDYS